MATFLSFNAVRRLADWLRPGLVAAALLLTVPLARAQGVFNMGSLTNTLSIPTDSKGSSTAATTKKNAAISRPYTPTPALKQQTVKAYADQLRPSDPTTAQVTLDTFGPGKVDYGQVYRGMLTGTGLRENDAVDAMTLYMLVGYAIVHNVQDGKAITPAMARGLRTQVASTAGGSAAFASPGGAAKLGEELKLQAVILQFGWEGAIKAGTLPAYRQRIAGMFRRDYNLDMAQLKLTSQGLARK
ncbi:hypothetical protein EJV47_15540 [Hymenobacter gummosus]|uniref:Uncharacterized protein n=1 Tax=Hymenobacter gummosus TaxID=1776032 RepID=A0A3S0H4E2_9BACT|nr:hypothetical protein [Hymenobacter gummosus]RTQ49001.1 hypothetical protein EJV47_15540 [Hymenobacter gummosus]